MATVDQAPPWSLCVFGHSGSISWGHEKVMGLYDQGAFSMLLDLRGCEDGSWGILSDFGLLQHHTSTSYSDYRKY